MTEASEPQSLREVFRQTATRAFSGSRIVSAVQSWTAQARPYVRASVLYQSGSRIVGAVRSSIAQLGRYVRGSSLAQWFTAESDPKVIVIDLRETWTVGPFISVLDRILPKLNRSLEQSRTAALATVAATAMRAVPIRVLGIVLMLLGAVVTIGTLLMTGARSGVVLRVLILGGLVILTGAMATLDRRD